MTYKIELTEHEHDTFLLALGAATGAMFAQGNKTMAYSFLRLANSINRDNPNYTPYEIPPEYQMLTI